MGITFRAGATASIVEWKAVMQNNHLLKKDVLFYFKDIT